MIDQQLILDKSQENYAEVLELRRHLHQNPELSFQEFKTTSLLFERLSKLGLDSLTKIDDIGIIGEIEGEGEGKTILLRADTDALPIQELNQVDYASENNGVMHACGHDAHSAMLYGVVRILADVRKSFPGKIRFVFQPAEERIPGGVELMIKHKVLEGVDLAIGQHVMPSIPSGKFGICSGQFMASSDEFYIKIIGKGGHGAMPEKCIDPVLIGSHFITAAQQLVSRYASPKTPSVLTFGRFEGLGAPNVIPDFVKLEGTFRTLDEQWREEAIKKVVTLCESLTKAMGGKCEIEVKRGYPYLHNDEKLFSRSLDHLQSFVGEENVLLPGIWMAAEDFARYSHEIPSLFYLLGVGNASLGISSDLHTPTFNIDEEALKTGMGAMAWMAVNELKSSES